MYLNDNYKFDNINTIKYDDINYYSNIENIK
jgi:hypothetical protein